MPMASTRAKSVIMLIEMPKPCMIMKVPMSETGTARVGIRVDRQSPRNTNTTSATSTKASARVWSTFSVDASRKLETS
ncbi:hypothetical protein D3C72_1120430 [compost metagenome]